MHSSSIPFTVCILKFIRTDFCKASLVLIISLSWALSFERVSVSTSCRSELLPLLVQISRVMVHEMHGSRVFALSILIEEAKRSESIFSIIFSLMPESSLANIAMVSVSFTTLLTEPRVTDLAGSILEGFVSYRGDENHSNSRVQTRR